MTVPIQRGTILRTMSRSVSRGMLQVRGVTYRIVRIEAHSYSVIRLLDDAEVGTFRTRPALRIHPLQIEADLLKDVVRAAMRSARTSAVMHVAPVFQPADDEAARTTTSAPPARPPSSAPPPEPIMV
jgi:hypothetical protein